MQTARQMVREDVPQVVQTSATISNKAIWTGRIISALPVLLMVFSGVMKLVKPPSLVDGFHQLGLPLSLSVGLGILEISCAVIYVIPRTAVLGAILITGYFGGAILTNVRLANPAWVMPLILGMLAWGGLFLRDRRIRELVPLRRTT
jgi:hypothetical protein